MKYYSTNNFSHQVSFKEAVFESLPPDNGLYFPEEIPHLSENTLMHLKNRSLESIGLEMMLPFIGDEIPEEILDEIIHESLGFELPIRQVANHIYSLELFHGPTWAFKDVGAKFLARCMGYFTQEAGKEIDILVATSGDTGGAVAAGFFNVPGTRVTILFPKGKVSQVQEQQLTSWGGNIRALRIDGTFDDCQAMVKQAFLDQDLKKHINLSSANSINVARFLPQSMYYAQVCREMDDKELVIAVPSGNYGNLTAGLIAKKMGLPIKRFIAASNSNKVVPDYLKTGVYEPRVSIATYSNAMDVGAPSNFVRMLELFDKNHQDMTQVICGFYLDDEGTLAAMRECFHENHYLADPHGVIAYQALKERLQIGETGVFLETAHPVKFQNVVDLTLDDPISYHDKVAELMSRDSQAIDMGHDFEALREFFIQGN